MSDQTKEPTREEQIAAGVQLPGAIGAYWRLVKRMDVDTMRGWLSQERILGTTPEELRDVVADVCGEMVYLTAAQVGRKQMKPFARDTLTSAAMGVDEALTRLDATKKAGSALRLVKG